jgi:hypothetical protein
MKLQAFPGCSGATVGGEQIEIDANGVCDVSPDAAKVLCESHGFAVFGEKKVKAVAPIDDKFTDMGRPEIIGYVKSKGVQFAPATSTDELRAVARTQYSPEERAADLAAAEARAKG